MPNKTCFLVWLFDPNEYPIFEKLLSKSEMYSILMTPAEEFPYNEELVPLIISIFLIISKFKLSS